MNTQIEGLRTIEPHTPSIRDRVMRLLKDQGPLTDPELVAAFSAVWGYDNYRSIGARRRELVISGVVQDTGQRKKNDATGVSNILWDLA